jgi:nicotinamidase-related amidase
MKNVLLVIDVQKALSMYEDVELESDIDKINALILKYPKENVYYIRHLELGTEFDPSLETSKIHPQLHVINENIILKYHHSAFYQTHLLDILKRQSVDTLDICGYQVEHCVDATIKTAHFLGFKVRVHENHIHTFDQESLSKHQIKEHYLNQFMPYAELI